MVTRYFILDEQDQPLRVLNYEVSALWRAEHWITRCVVGAKDIGPFHSGFFVATVFLGIDDLSNGEAPLLWETQVHNLSKTWRRRYSSRAEAVIGHQQAVDWAEAALVIGVSEGDEPWPVTP